MKRTNYQSSFILSPEHNSLQNPSQSKYLFSNLPSLIKDESRLNEIYKIIYPSISYTSIKSNSKIYNIGDTLLIHGNNEFLVGELVQIIPNNGKAQIPFWPTIEVKWYYKKADLNRKKNKLNNQHYYNSISDFEVFSTDHKDIIMIESIIDKCKVYSYEEYENLEDHNDKTFFTRAKYDPKTELLYPKIEDWKKGCVCQYPLNPDQLYIKCDKCEEWFHPECCGLDVNKINDVDEFYCPYCKAEESKETDNTKDSM